MTSASHTKRVKRRLGIKKSVTENIFTKNKFWLFADLADIIISRAFMLGYNHNDTRFAEDSVRIDTSGLKYELIYEWNDEIEFDVN